MAQIMMVDGYDSPFGFDGVRRRKSRKSRRRSRKSGRMTPAKLCAGAKRKKACQRAVRARKCK